MDQTPLSSAEFAACLARFPGIGPRVAVAVSGGPDSMALAYCLKRHGFEVLGLIVEHGLRPESPQEAHNVAQRLRAMGLEVEILPWSHPPISSRVHVQARRARYALLLDACHAHEVDALFLAHHADDQAETVLMRLAKGSGIDGLAAMAPEVTQDGARLLRPLLGVRKQRLIATCAAAEIPTVVDPSNEKDSYARGRLRRVTELLAQEGMTVENLTDLAVRAREAKEALDHFTKDYLIKSARSLAGGAIALDWACVAQAPQAIKLRVLQACLRAINRLAGHPPERAALLGLLREIENQNDFGCTLYGCAISRHGTNPILLGREVAAIAEQLPLAPELPAVWDGRWRVSLASDAGKGWIVAALGDCTHAQIDALAPELRKKIPQGRIRQTLPALWKEGRLVAMPSFTQEDQSVAIAALITPYWGRTD